MARSTGPILAAGAITIANRTVVHGQEMDWRIPIATGLAAGAFALLEKGFGDAAAALSWLVLGATLFVRIDPQTPTPIESIETFLRGTNKKVTSI